MKKLLRTMVVAPLYLFIYGVALAWSFQEPFWGFLALAALDVIGTGVVLIIVYRVVNVHGWLMRAQVREVAGWVELGLILMMVLHVIAAFMPPGELRMMVGYAVPTLPVALGVIYLLMKGRPEQP